MTTRQGSAARLLSLADVREVDVDSAVTARRLNWSIDGLANASPHLSSKALLSRRQRKLIIGTLVILGASALFDLVDTFIALLSVVTAIYIAVTINRVVLYARAWHERNVEGITDEEARATPDNGLPVYSVLVPAYHEPEVIQQLLTKLDRLEYPREKLDIKVILEGDDLATIDAVQSSGTRDHVEIVLVPPAQPRTKPKALNYALGLCRGEVVTIYDAEDDPEPLQLRRAALALERAGTETACVQAKLSFHNFNQNLITRWFTIEYAMWFSMFLPGLVSLSAPLPLGGTSNHFRRDVLEQLGAWDPYNVTEDADLGIRLARMGYRCGVLESTTLEEANSDFVNWIKQRSRWYKGYLQTSIVHLRHPWTLLHEIGWRGLVEVILFVLGTPLLAALNPVFWFLTLLWFSGHPHFIHELFPAGLFYPSVLCWVLGNFVVAYLTLLTCRLIQRYELLWAALLVPLYWVMMAIAAIKAFWQLVATPSLWEKTTHGLTDLIQTKGTLDQA
jgi:cellulose synthase/poly-beta-1,6-N-acetylglucosamine synthase-like glycosyltransferase